MLNQAENAVIEYFKSKDVLWARYYSPTLLAKVVKKIREDRLLPTIVSAGIAFRRLIDQGIIERTDGKNEDIDQAEEHAKAKRGLEATMIHVASFPLTRDEIEYFASLSQLELSKLYWGPSGDGINGFSVRYNKAIAEHGYHEPARYAGGLR
jgi:hypothetical protein